MALQQELKAIEEDFGEAYHSRKKDLQSIDGIDRKILKMHWGGVIVECFVKYLIVQKYSMNKRRKSKIGQWFSDYTENILREKEQQGHQLTGNDYKEYACDLESGHNFIMWIRKRLKFTIAGEIDDALNIVYNPLEYEGKRCFIDLRYESEHLQGIEDKYIKWKEAYDKVFTCLIGHLNNLNREDYINDTMGGD